MLTMEEIAVPEPDLTPDEVVARARALRDRVRAEAQTAEAAGRYSPELHRAFVEAGFFGSCSRGATGATGSTWRRSCASR